QLDSPLTAKGINSAKKLRDYFNNIEMNIIYSSDSIRARETCKHGFSSDTPLIISKLLRERSLGDFEGKRIEDVKKDQRYIKFFNDSNFTEFRHSFHQKAPFGENYLDVYKRIQIFFNQIFLNENHSSVIIAHQTTIRCCLLYLREISKEEVFNLRIPNCEPIVVDIKKGVIYERCIE
ncbi:TPA_asm: histidine phosphatase family protein, partial [Listeria monocytogenes]|nr:histidine phosphatase family protein [Listeria monocytogenes]